jgi:tRNA (guanine37-N1)-methyltransferase
MRYTFITLFPELIRPWLEESLIAKALQRGLLSAEVVDLRAFGLGRHRSVDDTPYGGGAGMVIRADVAAAAIESALPADEVILLSPAGRPLTQEVAEELSRKEHLVLLCGRYEGFDARVEAFVTRSLSIGDYVLMGGEVAALAVLEATARLVPGVIGDPMSHREDSFVRGLLDYPHYTRPPEFRGLKVPEVLLSGDHEAVARFRRKEALKRTLELRPELLLRARIGALEAGWLAEMDREG